MVDVPAKLAARVRLFDTGHNRKTDARDAHSVAMVAVRTEGLRVLQVDGELEALGSRYDAGPESRHRGYIRLPQRRLPAVNVGLSVSRASGLRRGKRPRVRPV